MIKITVKTPVGDDLDLTEIAAKKLKVKIKGKAEIIKKSLDARDKGRLCYVYTLAVNTDDKKGALKNGGEEYIKPKNSLDDITCGVKYVGATPIIVGAGPCGLFAALTLCKIGAKPIILERGENIENRKKTVDNFNKNLVLNTESNILFGEGGAGTFSDGKLNTGTNNPYVSAVLKELAECGAPEEITYLNKPHIGTDLLEKTVLNIRKKLLSYGAEIHFNTKVTDFIIENNSIKGVKTNKGEFYSDRVYLCIGHSARDTFETIYSKGIKMASKIFSMGVRIEHLQDNINIAQYGKIEKSMPSADYKCAVKLSDNSNLYTFCMCPGGVVVNASSEENAICINGMSNYARDGENANSALLINVSEREYGEGVLAGVEYQRRLEKRAFELSGSFKAPAQTFGDFCKGKTCGFKSIKPSVSTGFVNCDLNAVLPDFIAKGIKEGVPLMAKKIRGFDTSEAVLTGVETRSSSPVRILRDENCRSSVAGLYPLGEGAGYAGGITSAAADGIRGVLFSLTK